MNDAGPRPAGSRNVSGIKATGEKRLVLTTGRAHPALAEAIARELKIELLPIDSRTFANGEIYARYDESVRGSDAFVIQAHSAPINEWLMEQLIMVDALKRASAKRITVVAPFYPYARQDKKGRGREPISARLVADLFKAAGADRIMSVDLHAAQIQGFFDGPVDHLFAMPVLLEHFREKLDPSSLTVVSPDMGRVRVADIWSDKLGAPLAIIHKRRDPLVPNQVSVHEIVGDVDGRVCLLVDDLIDTGRTIVKAAEALKANGATGVVVAATHAVFSDPAIELLQSDAIDSVVVTDTLPVPDDKRFPTLEVLSIAPLLARAIREVFEDGSVTSMFDGAA
ncbi:Ribose-phosphate pyrophosphokinase [Mycetocola reblochoni REB411]|uniref:Ribose-phosphate pyrophosphokinase n=1 Tax=Mycetocola reblochoni REB411 TaxID=1255698 RepID=A0A1R4IZB1_9MICO|nr:Ribose-phosphate pyrophosphokinase [Mycetocola reblochoni REB411]